MNVQLAADEWAAVGAVTQAVASILTLVVAVAAVRYAARQVREARAQVDEARKSREAQAQHAREQSEEQAQREQRLREEQARPFVVVDFEPSVDWGNLINLVFVNVGKTLAKNVRFTFDPPLTSTRQLGGRLDIQKSAIMTTGIPAMPPGKRVETFFDLSHDRLTANLPMTYHVRVDLQDAQGREQEPLEYILDLNFLYGLSRLEVKTTHHIAKSIKEIEKSLAKWTQHSNGLRVWVRDEEAYFARLDEMYENQRREQDTTPSPGDDDEDQANPQQQA